MLWKKAPQDKAIVVTGLKRRVISGSGGIVIPYLEQISRISLENIKVEVKTHESLDSNGVPIDTDGVAIIKVNSDPKSVLLAVEQFNTGREKETINVIKETVQDVLEGKLREIVSKMTIEEIKEKTSKLNEKAMSLASRVYEEAAKANQGNAEASNDDEAAEAEFVNKYSLEISLSILLI